MVTEASPTQGEISREQPLTIRAHPSGTNWRVQSGAGFLCVSVGAHLCQTLRDPVDGSPPGSYSCE